MGDDHELEARLSAAAEAVREREVIERRRDNLEVALTTAKRRVAELTTRLADEQRDVDRLEKLSLTRVLVALRGARAQTMDRERAEADAVRCRLAEARARLDALRTENAHAYARLRALANAPAEYDAVLAEKERRLADSGDPRGGRLMALADERGRLAADLRETGEAVAEARKARTALEILLGQLENASAWSTYDTFLGGGALSSAIKHDHLEEAALAAAEVDRRLAGLRTELADVPDHGGLSATIRVDGLTQFADIWFDNIFTDWSVRGRIKQAIEDAARAAGQVDAIYDRLRQREARTTARLAEVEAERAALHTA